MFISIWLLDIAVPPDTGSRLADTLAQSVLPPVSKPEPGNGSFNLYLGAALLAVAGLAVYYFLRTRRNHNKDQA